MSRKTADVAWGNPPPPDRKPTAKIRRPGPGETLYFVIHDKHVTGVWTHWICGRTQPCLGKRCECQEEGKAIPKRWKGYLMGNECQTRKLVIVELTQEAYWSATELRDVRVNLRGARLTLTRLGKSPAGKVSARVELQYRPDTGPSPFEIELALDRVWFGEQERKEKDRRRERDQVLYGEEAPPDQDAHNQ